MDEEQFSIANDTSMMIVGSIARPKPRGKFPLVLLVGGFFDHAESVPIKELQRQFIEHGFAVCRFDFTNGFGRSEGRAADITVSQQVRDLSAVIKYCKRRGYVNPDKTSIFGIGLGAMSSLVHEAFQSEAKAIVLLNTPTGVDRLSWTHFDEREMFRIKLKRYFHVQFEGSPMLVNYTFFEDGQKIDISRCVRNLKTPVLLLHGEQSEIVKPEESAWIYERVPGEKRMELLPDFGAVDGRKGLKSIVDLAVPFLKRHKAA